jgi:hypothetical protein
LGEYLYLRKRFVVGGQRRKMGSSIICTVIRAMKSEKGDEHVWQHTRIHLEYLKGKDH